MFVLENKTWHIIKEKCDWNLYRMFRTSFKIKTYCLLYYIFEVDMSISVLSIGITSQFKLIRTSNKNGDEPTIFITDVLFYPTGERTNNLYYRWFFFIPPGNEPTIFHDIFTKLGNLSVIINVKIFFAHNFWPHFYLMYE
jgi:hypothetical protein